MTRSTIAIRVSQDELQMILDGLDILSPDSKAGEVERWRLHNKLLADMRRCFSEEETETHGNQQIRPLGRKPARAG